MEVERVPVCGVHGLQQQPRVPGAMGGGRSSLLSTAVQEMLMVQKSNKTTKKPPRATPRLPPVTVGRYGGGKSMDRGEATEPAPGRAARTRARQPLAKRVVRSMLKRSAPPPPDEKRKVLTCCCARLSPGLRCALHQCAPGRSWMRSQRAGSAIVAGEAVAARACGRGGWLFSEYARWRRSVWMPSRFYLERVDRQPRPPPVKLDVGRRRANCA